MITVKNCYLSKEYHKTPGQKRIFIVYSDIAVISSASGLQIEVSP
jgi:hypothetical protein